MPEHPDLSSGIHADFSLNDWLAYIEALHPKDIEMGLGRVNQVKQRLNLQYNFPVITVAGTNGKGSTCAMLEHIYHAAGYRVASYSSPHLLRYSERIRVARHEISNEALIRAFQAIESARQEIQLTYFEYGTLAAMWHFCNADVDVAILEVGLGGRLDAVNVFEPSCAIVTSVDLDHMDFLGYTRELIGAEKAGIFRANIPAICGDLSPPQSLINYAEGIGADLKLIQHDFQFERDQSCWRFSSPQCTLDALPMPALVGDFQLYNASCVMTAIQSLQSVLPVSKEAICDGLLTVRLHGRYQYLSSKPDVILDVAHNPHAAKSLAANLKNTATQGKTIAVFAMLADKDIRGVIQAIAGEVDEWYVSGISHVRGADALTIHQLVNAELPDAVIRLFDGVKNATSKPVLMLMKMIELSY
ncbi:bifunctional tetrahydrofolate synthase/dihydrofolate synthase [Candidatus Methylopumilus turicensis]|uniref:Dihydrofolate synthase/folylpolyglutamate synthase n=1 Tax=Candidatus Methylopumilus turicensis TaxID=1581680 RepID=A0A0B7IUT3_9PROT|nr:bifunctional tetrahydrofolate synthase/dihydrofolate synthase [Candidatus Methylopumilus turicensis]CEN56025.1 bifunctional folylpolyglutamate synthase and dihydrofolate synthase [Candidatus Methylopumilus turicensis]